MAMTPRQRALAGPMYGAGGPVQQSLAAMMGSPQAQEPVPVPPAYDPVVTRGQLLPVGRMESGDLGLAMPQIPLDIWDAIQTANRYSSGGVPFAERDVKDVARVGIELAGTGYTKGLLSGVPEFGMLAQSSWHGGPNKWLPEPNFPQGRPRLDKMGTGEGAQAYGWGFYSADSPGVATSYKEGLELVGVGVKVGRHPIELEGGGARIGNDYYLPSSSDEYVDIIEPLFSGDDINRIIKVLEEKGPSDSLEFAHLLKDEGVSFYDSAGGALYHLDLPDEDVAKYLDWDAPLSEQPESVKVAIQSLDPGYRNLPLDTSASQLVKELGRNIGKQEASEALRAAGIPGLKYFDQMSRPSDAAELFIAAQGSREAALALAKKRLKSATEEFGIGAKNDRGYWEDMVKQLDKTQTRNYVTWDQDVLDRVKILERDGETFLPTVDSSIHGNTLTIHKIETPPDMRGTGKAEQALTDVLRQADEQGLQVVLTPSNAFGAARGRLEKWYRRHGFVPNKGRNKDFSTRESMIRRARSLPNTLSSSGPPLGLLQGAQTAWDQFTGDRS